MSDQPAPRADPVDQPISWESARAFLKYAIAFVLVGSAAFVAAIVVFAPDQSARAFGPASMSLVATIAWLLLARGRVEAAVHVLGFGLWAAVTGIAYFTGGVGGMAIIVYPQLILLLGWLVGTRAAVVMALLAVAATLAFALAESWAMLPLPPPTPPAMRWIVQCFVFAFSVILIVSFVRSYQARLWAARQDIAERDRAQKELGTSIAFRELLLEALPLPVFYKDTTGRYAGGNSAFAAFIGRPIKDIVGKTVYDLWPHGFAQSYRDKDIDLLTDPLGLEPYESRIPHADGTIHDVIVYKARIVDAAGTPTGVLGVFTDITGIKRNEAVRDQLEAQLRESQKMEALGTLAGGVAHDFNNIVATIMGNAELALRDVGPDSAVLESLEEISKASRRAKELVQQILAFGRRQVLERKLMLLAPVVEESARLLRAALPAGVRLSVACAPDAPAVFADATQVQQVLLNLCANAWQAIQEQRRPGSVEVRLSAYDQVSGETRSVQAADRRSDLRAGCYACLTVSDNGPGMDAATRARIFEPFFTTKPVGMGTGLGLAVVHGIAQEHGARIEVESTPGAGTTFRIYFPAVRAVVPTVAAPPAEGAPARGQGKRILYVDDDEAIVFLMTRLLERQGYRVSGYTDAREALEAVRAQPQAFDLVVTDYNMPGMSGLEAARALREIRADLPVALTSGHITEELRAKAPAAGVSELIYKPITADELCGAIARLAKVQRGENKLA